MEKLEKEKLEEITQSKLNFFTYISHEIRTPLTLINGPVKNLIQNSPTLKADKRLKLYHLIEKNSTRIQALINQLFDFRKAELGKLRVNVQELEIISLSKLFLENYIEWSEHKGIKLKFKSNRSECSAWVDPDIYEKIINNLLSNAIKYTPRGGEVSVNITIIDQDQIQLQIKDTGDGIAEDQIPLIFDMFYKTNQSKENHGTGIGLSFVKSLVKLHHGQISCSSQINKGTSILVSFPITSNSYASHEIAVQPNPVMWLKTNGSDNTESEISTLKNRKSKGDDIKLLMIEDNIEIIQFVAENLPSKFKVYSSENGKEGLEMALKVSPDIVVSDIMMPIMDGIQFCSNLKNHPDTCHIPVILLSARNEDKDHIEGFSIGADAYLSKPFSIDVLVSNIDSILKNRQILKDKFKQQLNISPSEITVTNKDEVLMDELIKNIEENISNSDYKIQDLAKNVGISVSRLNVKLKGITGLTLGQFIRTFRLKRSAQLIEKTDLTVSEITYKVGFSDLKYFRNCFRKEFGYSPSQYRANLSSKQAI